MIACGALAGFGLGVVLPTVEVEVGATLMALAAFVYRNRRKL